MGPPIVLERSKKGRGKKKRKPRIKELDRAERYLYRATKRTVGAADKGLRTYDKARRRSARRYRDGAVIELVPNVTRGMVVGAGRMAPVPLDLVRAAWPRSVRRSTRRSVRSLARVMDRS
jgi:hypothetical protein